MIKQKRISALVLFAVMLLCMAAFSSAALADGKKPTNTPTPTPTATSIPTPSATPVPAVKTLTPDGNLTLVDDIAGAAAEDKQFITVVTKNGNYFYLIIDRASNSDNVYFLNKVDEADLMAILEEAGYEIEATPTPSPSPKPTADIDAIKDADAKQSGSPLLPVALVAAGGIGAFIYFKKKKAAPKSAPRMEDFAYEDEDDEDEEADEDGGDEPTPMNHAVQRKGKWDGVV